ncbi:MAG: hypothetical protein HYU54_09480 [Actinobacteria bacterium]|nr:hypothetical protein [Actinomycetota bacterium]
MGREARSGNVSRVSLASLVLALVGLVLLLVVSAILPPVPAGCGAIGEYVDRWGSLWGWLGWLPFAGFLLGFVALFVRSRRMARPLGLLGMGLAVLGVVLWLPKTVDFGVWFGCNLL